jgi:ATP-binding cassette subfamily C (CFTR/MRP) protein 4
MINYSNGFINFSFARLTQPFFLGKLIDYYASENPAVNDAYIYSGAIVLTCALNVLSTHAYMQVNFHVGMKLRVAACSLIYRKSLKLSKNALIDTTSGQIVNLLSNDVGR